VVKKD